MLNSCARGHELETSMVSIGCKSHAKPVDEPEFGREGRAQGPHRLKDLGRYILPLRKGCADWRSQTDFSVPEPHSIISFLETQSFASDFHSFTRNSLGGSGLAPENINLLIARQPE